MNPSDYPQDISTDEADHGFLRLELQGLGRLGQAEIVIGRILSSSDILIKVLDLQGRTRYSHRRWGYSQTASHPNKARWNPLTIGPLQWEDVPQFIQEFDFVTPRELYPDIVGMPMQYRVLKDRP